MIDPQPPLTAAQLLDWFNLDAQSEIVAQLRIDQADHLEQRSLDKCAVQRWKQPWD